MVQRVELYDFASVQNPSFMKAEWRSVFVVTLVIGPFEQMYEKKLLETA